VLEGTYGYKIVKIITSALSLIITERGKIFIFPVKKEELN
jgi:hypothetical protein